MGAKSFTFFLHVLVLVRRGTCSPYLHQTSGSTAKELLASIPGREYLQPNACQLQASGWDCDTFSTGIEANLREVWLSNTQVLVTTYSIYKGNADGVKPPELPD